MTNLPPATPTRILPAAETEVFEPTSPMNPSDAEPNAATQVPAAAVPPVDPAATGSLAPTAPVAAAPAAAPATTATPASAPASTATTQAAAPAVRRPMDAPQRTALVVLAAMGVLVLAFIVMLIVGVSAASINALAVIATPIASMVAAYYGITLSIQQVKNERAEKERAIARAEAADTTSRETEVWAAQMESGLRVAMAKLNAAQINTDEVTKAAGAPDDFF